MSESVRVMVGDDQALVRAGLMTLLDGAPDVVLMDLHMPVLDGVEATRRIRDAGRAAPCPEIVVLTTHSDEASILDAMRAGARGYLTRDAGLAEIARAVHAAAAHHAFLDPAVHARLLAAAEAGARDRAPAVHYPYTHGLAG